MTKPRELPATSEGQSPFVCLSLLPPLTRLVTYIRCKGINPVHPLILSCVIVPAGTIRPGRKAYRSAVIVEIIRPTPNQLTDPDSSNTTPIRITHILRI